MYMIAIKLFYISLLLATQNNIKIGDKMLDINVSNISKKFGNKQVIDDVSFTVEQGSIVGFLGQNGAGKTTIIKMLTNQLIPNEGTIEIFNKKIEHHNNMMKEIGYVPDTPILYEGLSPREMLEYIGKLYGMSGENLNKRIDEVVSLLNMKEFEHELIKNFSLGMKKKVSLACGIIHSPRLLILDEVTNGLDPRVAREVKDLIFNINHHNNVTCFITTHILDVIEELSDKLIIIEKGNIIESGTLDESIS